MQTEQQELEKKRKRKTTFPICLIQKQKTGIKCAWKCVAAIAEMILVLEF